MGNELTIIAPRTIEEVDSLAKKLAPSVAVPTELRGKPHDVMAIVMRGAELGLPPMTALSAMHCIKGRVTLSADGMAALVRRNRDVCKYLRVVESTGLVATYETQREGDPSPTRMSFTIQQAKAAGLGGDNWAKYPDAMLRARCLSAICRAVYSDLVLGLYDPEELGGEPAALPDTKQPPPPAPANVVEAEVVPVPDAKPSPPERKRLLQIDDKAADAPKAVEPPELADVDAIRAAASPEALVDLMKAKGKGWSQATRAEWGSKYEALQKARQA